MAGAILRYDGIVAFATISGASRAKGDVMSADRIAPCILLAAFLLAVPSLAEEGDQLWQHSYGGVAQERGDGVQATSDGGLILVGYTLSSGHGGRDVYLVKVDAGGEVEWEGAFGTAANDEGKAVIQTADGGYLVAGNLNIGSQNTMEGLLIKVDGNGAEQWQATYGGATEDQFLDVAECAHGGYVMVGVTTSYGPGGHAAWIVRVDAASGMLWQNAVALAGHGFDYFTTVATKASGDFAAGGYSGDGVTFPEYDAESAGFDSLGTLTWQHTYDDSYYDRIYGMTATADGGLAFGGVSTGGMTIWRTAANGVLIWRQQFQTITNDTGLDVIETADDGFLIGGSTYNYGDGAYQMYVGKTDAGGEPLWERLYGGDDDEGCSGVAETPNGDYALAGTTNSIGAGSDDLILILVEGPGATAGIVPSPAAMVAGPRISAYPNPFNPVAVITLRLPAAARTDLAIVDVRGRRVRTLLRGEELPAGAHELRWNGRDDNGRPVSSGVYLIRSVVDGARASHRITLLK
jgi:hypothetical protein